MQWNIYASLADQKAIFRRIYSIYFVEKGRTYWAIITVAILPAWCFDWRFLPLLIFKGISTDIL